MGLGIDFSRLWSPPKFGWVDRPMDVGKVLGQLPYPDLASYNDAIKGSGAGKVVLLHEAVNTVRPGGFPLLRQEIGDCVSFGYAVGTMVLVCVQIAVHGRAEQWPGDIATEPIYGGSRVEVGGGRLWGDGSIGAWAAKWVSERGGILLRKKYEGLDLTTYAGSRAKQMGRSGVPDHLEPEAKLHPVRTASLCTSYNDARDAIASGRPVVPCSMQGFASRRDEKGFARPQGRWPHCMCFIAVDDSDRRPGLLCYNQWGNWISGPKRHNQPEGSFWVDAEVCDRMLRHEDSFALSEQVGWPAAPTPLDGIDWSKLWTLRAPTIGAGPVRAAWPQVDFSPRWPL